jgi:hypothetical protein
MVGLISQHGIVVGGNGRSYRRGILATKSLTVCVAHCLKFYFVLQLLLRT